MKIQMIKLAGGVLSPANDIDAEMMQKYKNLTTYEVEIKLFRNPAFHAKVFAFFHFCFAHWVCDRENMSSAKQFEVFRHNLTVNAGYYDSFYNIKNEVRVEAKSLSFASMSQEEFEECYSALINAALKHIFNDSDDETYNKLLSFF